MAAVVLLAIMVLRVLHLIQATHVAVLMDLLEIDVTYVSRHVCLSVCLPAGLPVLSVGLSVCRSVCWSVCLSDCLSVQVK